MASMTFAFFFRNLPLTSASLPGFQHFPLLLNSNKIWYLCRFILVSHVWSLYLLFEITTLPPLPSKIPSSPNNPSPHHLSPLSWTLFQFWKNKFVYWLIFNAICEKFVKNFPFPFLICHSWLGTPQNSASTEWKCESFFHSLFYNFTKVKILKIIPIFQKALTFFEQKYLQKTDNFFSSKKISFLFLLTIVRK